MSMKVYEVINCMILIQNKQEKGYIVSRHGPKGGGNMSSKKPHISNSFLGGDWVHDGNCNVIGWVDDKGDVHPKGDVGTCFSGYDTIIGHVDDDGAVSITDKE